LPQVFRKWLVASVTRTYEPGAKFDWMPILEGAQGTGKSSFGAVLFGQRYFADWLPNLADKDAALAASR
jgi:predicted P-loop ATPase